MKISYTLETIKNIINCVKFIHDDQVRIDTEPIELLDQISKKIVTFEESEKTYIMISGIGLFMSISSIANWNPIEKSIPNTLIGLTGITGFITFLYGINCNADLHQQMYNQIIIPYNFAIAPILKTPFIE